MSRVKIPTEKDVFALVRESCRACLEHATDVRINLEAATAFAATLDAAEVHASKRKGFPLKFPNRAAEINFLTLLGLLEFGSAYRVPLHKYTSKGASETMSFGLMGMFITGEINTTSMLRLSLHDVSSTFNIPVDQDFELSPGISSVRPHELRPLAEKIRATMHETAGILRAHQCDEFGAFILNEAKEKAAAEGKGTPATAAELVRRLAESFPAFADRASYTVAGPDGITVPIEVWFLKKAQLVAFDLYNRFGAEEERLNFKDVDQLTVFADNVIPAVLRKAGVIEVNEALAAKIADGKPLTVREEAELRAAAIIACDMIVELVNKTLASAPSTAAPPASAEPLAGAPPAATEPAAAEGAAPATSSPAAAAAPSHINAAELDYYLWRLGKDPEYRSYTRHVSTDTVYY